MGFDDSVPLYYQVAIAIKQKIENGQFGPGSKLPADEKLSKQYNVSRVTIRNALENLINMGLVEHIPNKGHFVCRMKEYAMVNLSLHEELCYEGSNTSSVILSMETESANEDLCRHFGCEKGIPIIAIHRIRYANNIPFADDMMYLQEKQFEGLNPWALERESFIRIMREKYNIDIGNCIETLEPRLPTEEQAELLGIPINKSQLFISSNIEDKSGQVVKHSDILFVSSVVEYSFTWEL